MRKASVALAAIFLASLALVGTASAQDDAVLGTVTSDPQTVPEAGEYTITATGSGFIPDTSILFANCVAPGDVLVPGEADLDEIGAAALQINPLADCDVAAAQAVDVDGNGGWTAEVTAEVGANFFLLGGALDGSQGGATWIPIVPEGAGDAEADDGDADDDAAEADDAADDEDAALADTGVEAGLLAVIGTAVLGAGVLMTREGRRFRP